MEHHNCDMDAHMYAVQGVENKLAAVIKYNDMGACTYSSFWKQIMKSIEYNQCLYWLNIF